MKCKHCKHWERNWVWSFKTGTTYTKYGDCHNEKLYNSFSYVEKYYGDKLFPLSKPDEDFGCIFFEIEEGC